MSEEPQIIINGKPLTPAEAMAVRVAVTNVHAEMSEPGALGDDEHGTRMASAYRDRLWTVLKLMFVDQQTRKEI